MKAEWGSFVTHSKEEKSKEREREKKCGEGCQREGWVDSAGFEEFLTLIHSKINVSAEAEQILLRHA